MVIPNLLRVARPLYPRGGIKKGVFTLGLWYGCMLKDRYRYLIPRVRISRFFYKRFTEVDQVNGESDQARY